MKFTHERGKNRGRMVIMVFIRPGTSIAFRFCIAFTAALAAWADPIMGAFRIKKILVVPAC